jgi:hypothetical protein
MPASQQAAKYKTQWATQFFAAAELTRRDYVVSLTFGNAAIADLHIQSPHGALFTVDVKGQSNKSFWLVQRREALLNHYYVLVYLPPALAQPRYFILSSTELMRRRSEYEERSRARGKYRDALGGMNWATAHEYENCWEHLPK